MWTSALIAFAIVFTTAAITSLFVPNKSNNLPNRPIENFLLANQSLSKSAVISLLLSSSFGLNALFYQVWLGYSVGAWALVAQGAWALSFVFLAPFSKEIKKHKSLHDIIGSNFGKSVRILAGICSLIGIMYLMGWEVAVGTSTMEGLFVSNNQNGTNLAQILTGAIVLGCLLYTVLGGLKGNAVADKFLNLFKLIIITGVTIVLASNFIMSDVTLIEKFFPSINTMEKNLGWWGLITNIIFSLTWQFVDNSTWQSVIGGIEKKEEDTSSNLKLSGLAVFIAPGIIGTILGVSLNNMLGVTPDNVLSKAFGGISVIDNEILLILMFIVIISCIMSMIDGLFLASAFALIIDIFHPNESFTELDRNPVKSEKMLVIIRLSLIACALIGIFGVKYLFDLLDISLFDFVYVVIITQLSLIGPVLYSLLRIKLKPYVGHISIILSLVVGFSSVFIGNIFSKQWMIDGAGTFTVITSLLVILFFNWFINKK